MIAFKTWNQAPSNPKSVPSEWPWIQESIDSSEVVAKLEAGYQCLSDEAFAAYIDARQESYDEWLEANPNETDFIINQMILTTEQLAQLETDNGQRKFASNLMAVLKVLNKGSNISFAQSVWLHHRFRAVEIVVTSDMATAMPVYAPLVGLTLTLDILNMVIPADLETVYFVLSAMTLDDMTEDYHVLDANLVGFIKTQIETFLGWG
jgi:hypothetical protein